MKKRVLVLAHVASMISQFNMPNIRLLLSMGYQVDVATNFLSGYTCTKEEVEELKHELNNLGVHFYQVDFSRKLTKVKDNLTAYRQTKRLLQENQYEFIHCQSPIGGMITRIANRRIPVSCNKKQLLNGSKNTTSETTTATQKSVISKQIAMENATSKTEDIVAENVTSKPEDIVAENATSKPEDIVAENATSKPEGIAAEIETSKSKSIKERNKYKEGHRAKIIYTAHGFHFYKGAPLRNWLLFYPVEWLCARWTDVLITINKEDYERAKCMMRHRGVVVKIPGVGLDTEKFCRNNVIRDAIRKQLKIPENAFHMVSVGQLNKNKNHEIVIKSLAKLKDKDIVYSICGTGEEKERLLFLIRKYKLKNQVRLLGYRKDIFEILQGADCFVFPSKREGLGIAAIEALSCEVPVIAADNRGTREFLKDRVNGFICNNRDRKTYIEAIRSLKKSEPLRQAFGKEARETALLFDIKTSWQLMTSIYQGIRNR